MNRCRLARARLGILLLLAGGAAAPLVLETAPRVQAERSEQASAATHVPFELLPTNHMVVRAKLNGKGPYRLIFDLGSPVTLLGSKVAETTGAIPKDAPTALLFRVRGEGTVKTLELGDLVAEDVPVVVMDHPALKMLRGPFGRPIEGIVGYTFFARYRMTIDYKARTLSFVPVDFQTKNVIRQLESKLLGPREARTRVVGPQGLWGLTVAEVEGGGEGVEVRSVQEGSAADVAGLRPGDVLLSIDGRWTASVPDAYAAAGTIAPGQSAPVVIRRAGQDRTIVVAPRPGI